MAVDKESKYPTRFISPIAIGLVADNVRKYRTEKKMSIQTLANIVGVEYSVISRLELQKSNPTISVIFAIGQALEIEPDLLLKK